MQYTPNYNLKKPDPTDNYNIQNDNDNMDAIDDALNEHVSAKSGVHGATFAATPSTLVQRDASGRFKAAAPAAADDVARKAETDAALLKTGGKVTGNVHVDAGFAAKGYWLPNSTTMSADLAMVDGDYTHYVGWIEGKTGYPHNYGSIEGFKLSFSHPYNWQIFRMDNGKSYWRKGGGVDTWGPWEEFITSAGGTFTGLVNFAENIYVDHAKALYGRTTNGDPAPMVYVSPGNNVIVGTPNLTTSFHSLSTPNWWNGSVLRTLVHSGSVGSGQSVNGGLSVSEYVASSGLTSSRRSGATGGLFSLRIPETTSLSGDYVNVDMHNNSFRVFEDGGSARGVSLDLTQCAPGAGSVVWHSGNAPASGSTNGYQRLPNGLIFLWGVINMNTTTANTFATVTLPLAVAGLLNVQVTGNDSWQCIFSSKSWTTTGFEITCSNAGTTTGGRDVRWFAVGIM